MDEPDDGTVPSAADPEEAKARWVEATHQYLRWVPRWQRKSFRKDFLQVLICAGWDPEEAGRVVKEILP